MTSVSNITPSPLESKEKVFSINILDLEENPILIDIPAYMVSGLTIGKQFAHGATSFVFEGKYENQKVAIKITLGKIQESKWLDQLSRDKISPKLFAQFELDTDELDVKPLGKFEPALSSTKKMSIVVSELMDMTLSRAIFQYREIVEQKQDKILREMTRFRDYFYQHDIKYGDINTDNLVLNLNPFKLRLVDFEDMFIAKDQDEAQYFASRWDKAMQDLKFILQQKPLSREHKIHLADDYQIKRLFPM
jgi:hypothetical protein